MQNIMFTPPSDAKILDGTKTMTARCWKKKPPHLGALMTASTGYKKETRFAIIRVRNVWEWNGFMGVDSDAEAVTGMTKQEIAEREGFKDAWSHDPDTWLTDWDAFIEAYYSINATKFLDDDRKDYFIAFHLLQPYTETPSCTGCEKPFTPEELNWTYSNSPVCDRLHGNIFQKSAAITTRRLLLVN